MPNFIDLTEVRKSFEKPTPFALSIPTLQLPKACFVSVVGPSGSGKSTLLNLISGLDSPDSGSISIAGKKLHEMSSTQLIHFRAFSLGFVFQSHNLFPTLNSLENTEITSLMRGDNPKEVRQRAQQALDYVGLNDFAKSYPGQLSGGQQQRVAIARALTSEPDVLIADEPTASLDSKTAANVIDLLENLNKKRGTSIIFSTHDPRILERSVQKITIRDGAITSIEG